VITAKSPDRIGWPDELKENNIQFKKFDRPVLPVVTITFKNDRQAWKYSG
jgi:hypothetical protein